MTTGTAVGQALKTIEILEQILVHLAVPNFEPLVKARAVCYQWKTTIDASLPLQQALFLTPATSGDLCFALSERESSHSRNKYRLNPLLVEHSVSKWKRWQRIRFSRKDITLSFLFTPSDLPLSSAGKEADQVTDGSWKLMYVTQPPCKKVLFLGTDLKAEDDDGVKLGRLCDDYASTFSPGSGFAILGVEDPTAASVSF